MRPSKESTRVPETVTDDYEQSPFEDSPWANEWLDVGILHNYNGVYDGLPIGFSITLDKSHLGDVYPERGIITDLRLNPDFLVTLNENYEFDLNGTQVLHAQDFMALTILRAHWNGYKQHTGNNISFDRFLNEVKNGGGKYKSYGFDENYPDDEDGREIIVDPSNLHILHLVQP